MIGEYGFKQSWELLWRLQPRQADANALEVPISRGKLARPLSLNSLVAYHTSWMLHRRRTCLHGSNEKSSRTQRISYFRGNTYFSLFPIYKLFSEAVVYTYDFVSDFHFFCVSWIRLSAYLLIASLLGICFWGEGR